MTQEERQQRAAERKQVKDRQWKQELADRALVGEAMRKILSDDEATTREKIFAALVLDNVSIGSLVPWRASKLYDHDVDMDAFKTAVEAIRTTDSNT